MTHIIAVGNNKGGVGKTTSVLNISSGLNLKGYRVLMVDLDGQCSLSISCRSIFSETKGNQTGYSSYKALRGEGAFQVDRLIDGLDLLPADMKLADIDAELSGVLARETILKEHLDKIKSQYDFIILDCPPAIGVATFNAFVAADSVIIPLQAEFLAYHGLAEILKVMKLIQAKLNAGLQLMGIFVTRFDKRKILNKHIVKSVERDHGAKFFESIIRENVAIAEAPSKGLDIFSYAPSSVGAKDYRKLVDDIIKKSKGA
jgi:chromosome partitioning protein